MQRRTIAIVCMVAVGIMAVWCYRFVQVDDCLDDGGSFNYQTRKCEH